MELIGLALLLIGIVISIVVGLSWREKANRHEKYWRHLEKENFNLRETLGVYANKDNYEITGMNHYIGHGDFETETWREIERDLGGRARRAL